MIVDCAHYKSGARQHEGPMSIADAASCASGGDGFVWVGIHDPTPEELDEIASRFPLHDLSVEDARHVHQRAKIERYERHYFVVLRTAHYDEKRGEVVFGEIHIFAGRGFAITLRHGSASELSSARERLEARPQLLESGPLSVVWAVLDKVVGGWQLAGSGSLRSTWFALPTGNWNFTGEPVQNYGYKYPIENCTSGVCVP